MSSYTDDRSTQRFGPEAQHGPQGQQGGGFGWSPQPQRSRRREKPFFLTSEFLTLLASIAAVVIAAAVADDFGSQRAWTLVTVLAAAYMISRGLSKVARGDGRLDND
jgi:hypothetical protein